MEQLKVVAALRQFIEVDNDKALVSVKMLVQHRVVTEFARPKYNLVDFKDGRSQGRARRPYLEEGEKPGQTAFVDTTRLDRNKWSPPLVDSDWRVVPDVV